MYFSIVELLIIEIYFMFIYYDLYLIFRLIKNEDEVKEDSYIFTPGSQRRIWVGGR